MLGCSARNLLRAVRSVVGGSGRTSCLMELLLGQEVGLVSLLNVSDAHLMSKLLVSSCPSRLLALSSVTEQVHQEVHPEGRESFDLDTVGSPHFNFTLSLKCSSVGECVLTCNT